MSQGEKRKKGGRETELPVRKGTHPWSPRSPVKTLYDGSVVSVPARCSPVGPAQAAASMYVTGLPTQQTLLLFAETLRLVLVVFATVRYTSL